MIYKFYASGEMGIDGASVKEGTLVATVATDYPLDDVLSGIRLRQFTIAKSESVLTPVAEVKPLPSPSPVEETTKTEETPVKGEDKDKKSRWSTTRPK